MAPSDIAGFTVFVQLQVDEAVIEQMLSPEWQKDFYTFGSRQECIEYLAWQIGVRECRLSMMDGWANFTDDQVRVFAVDHEAE